jgi:integrase
MILTDLKCKTAKPKEKAYILSDGEGMYLEVMPTGGRYWRLKYRFHGKQKRIALGSYPEVSLLEARDRRRDHRDRLKKGEDPLAIRYEEKKLARYKAAQTFQAVAEEWHAHHYDTWSRRHADQILHRLKRDVFTQIGSRLVSDLNAPMVLACLQRIEGRKAHEMAKRAMQMIGQVMRYAVVTGRAERDFTIDLKGSLKRYNKGHYAAISVDELPQLVKAINRNDTRIFRQTLLATKLMMLTFVRTNELIQAKWTEFDLEKGEWHIPAERMKMRRPHFVPLSRQSLVILHELKELNGKRQFILPSIPRPEKPMSNATILKALDLLGYKNKMTGHGFRALAMSSIKEKLGYRHEVIDRQLSHEPENAIDRAYDRAQFIQERIRMMQEWADYIDSLA